MEEEVSYSTVVFKNGGTAPEEKKEVQTVYSQVNPTRATVPNGEAAARSHFRVLAACFGMLCVFLVANIGAIIYFSMVMKEQQANLSVLTAEKEKLMVERSFLERKTDELSRITDNLNWTLGFIMNFTTFPVNDFCPDKKCQECQKDWILFQGKCYLFYEKGAPWMNWQDSRKFCQQTAADLVVINNLYEQEFISNHTITYHDSFHGYWIGLYEIKDNNWVWVDGRNDTLGYWIMGEFGKTGPCALTIPGKKPAASWDPAECVMENKFICESDVLIRSY